MEKGKLIVIEGACDGIGKTTQYKKLYEHLRKDGYEVIHHHFPSYKEYQGLPVEKYLKGEYGNIKELSPYFVHSLYEVDRAITWYSKLKPLYEEGKVVLLDRYTSSSLIYQSALIEDIEERKKFIDDIIELEYHKVGIKEPDHVIFLYAPFDMVTRLRNERSNNEGVEKDIHEKDLSFLKKVYENALFVADYLSWDKIICNDKDQMRNIEDIHKEIYQKIIEKK